MTTARKELVDVSTTRWYHCISRCVRQAFILADELGDDRKQWIEDRLELLVSSFSIGVAGFSVMDNHLHVLVRLDPEESASWSDEEVVRRWIAVYPPATLDLSDPNIVQMWVDVQVKDAKRVQLLRERLSNLGWFMKSLKEPLSRLCNKKDGARGAFWEARYKSIAVLDEEALLATCAYIDLNPVAAGVATVPEHSKYTSVRQRVAHAADKGKLGELKAARQGSVAGSRVVGNLEQDHWLVPIEDRRQLPGKGNQQARPGMATSTSLGSYLLLVEYTGRLFRNGKANISAGLRDVFERLGTSAEFWNAQLNKMLRSFSFRGHVFAAQPAAVQDLSQQRGRRITNLSPQLAHE